MKYAFYDLAASPVTWEFMNFALMAKADDCDVIAVVAGRRAASITHYSDAIAQRRIETMMIPLTEALGMKAQFITREQMKKLWIHGDCFPSSYHPESPLAAHYLRTIAPRMPLGIELNVPEGLRSSYEKAFGGAIVMTIREQTFQRNRNSNIAEWIKAAHQLKERGFRVVFVPDFDKLQTDFDGHEVCYEAAYNMNSRIALASVAMVNLYIPNGPCAISIMTSLPCIVLKLVVQGYANSEERVWRKAGIPEGTQPHWFGPHQRFVWRNDSADQIVRSVDSWCAANPERMKVQVA